MDVRVGLWRKLSTEELMLLNCGVGEDSWESLGLQGDPPVHSEGDQPWDFFGRTDAKAETPVLWPRHAKTWLIGKDPDAGRDWGQEEKGTTEDEMAGWHHQLMDVSLSELLAIVMDREAWRAVIHGVTKSRTRLSDWSDLIWSVGQVNHPNIHQSSGWYRNKVGHQFSSVQSLSRARLFVTPGSQHARPPCPSPSPGVHSNSRPSVGDAIQPSHPLLSPFPPAPNSSQHQSLFQWVNSLHDIVENNSPRVSCTMCLSIRNVDCPCPRLPLQGYLYCKQPWKIEIISTS